MIKFCEYGEVGGHCSNLAEWMLTTKKDVVKNYCTLHKEHMVHNKRAYKSFLVLDQKNAADAIRNKLLTFVGRDVFSLHHKNKEPFTGKYIKNNCILMCQAKDQSWKAVFYDQIKDTTTKIQPVQKKVVRFRSPLT